MTGYLYLVGNGGDDTFVSTGFSNFRVDLVGGSGIDTLDFSNQSGPLTFTLDIANPGGLPYTNIFTGSTYAAMNAVVGTSANDTLNIINGGGKIDGFSGNDTITGSGSADVLIGGDGNDIIYSNGGLDIVIGGAGVDTFYLHTNTSSINENALPGGFDFSSNKVVYNLTSESPSLALADVVNYFEQGIDKIDLSGMDANLTLAGNQAFSFAGYVNPAGPMTAFSVGIGTNWTNDSTTHTAFLYVNNTGGTGIDMVIKIDNIIDNVANGVAPFSGTDIIL